MAVIAVKVLRLTVTCRDGQVASLGAASNGVCHASGVTTTMREWQAAARREIR